MIGKQIEAFPAGRVIVLSIQNPPVNGLGSAVRTALDKALDEAIADRDVQAIVLTGAGRFFSGGADIREFNTSKSMQEPVLRNIISKLENSTKPTVAAINGMALGGGLELALGCHYRVAIEHASLGLPEVKLGVLPGAGGTQRLPRLIGIEAALDVIVNGEAMKADEALHCGLLDQVVSGDLVHAACLLGLRIAGSTEGVRRLDPAPVAAPQRSEVFDQARQTAGRRYRGCVAPLECIACVEKTLTSSLDEGLEFERQRFQVLVNGDQSKAQRHIFFAERAAMKLADAEVQPEPIKRVGVVGAGTMGGGIAMSLANAGIPVVLIERDQAALNRGWDTIKRNYSASVSRKKLDQPEMERRLALIKRSVDDQDLSSVDLVIEAAFEDMAVKREIFLRLDAVCRPGTILASNTSRLDINELATVTSRPGRVIGTHFFSPANVMRLLEVVRGARTDSVVIASMFSLARKIGKIPVLVGVCDGFVGNRMVSPYTREAHFLLEEGASPAQVDGALQRFGMAMGPLRMGDMAGLDISWAARKRMAPTRPAHIRYCRVADRICEMGRLGQKTGAGFYRYEEGSRDPIPDPVIDELIKECAHAAGIERRAISDDEIIERTIYALVNEGARILEEGIAQRSSDIDVIYVAGYGFPIFRGGPMFYADTVGLPKVLEAVERFHAEHGELWTPAPLLKELASSGRKFSDL